MKTNALPYAGPANEKFRVELAKAIGRSQAANQSNGGQGSHYAEALDALIDAGLTVLSDFVHIPSIVTEPVITGQSGPANAGELGDVLTVSNGTWDHAVDSYTYKWHRDGVHFGGGTGASHTIVEADQGTVLTCSVRATNVGGTSEEVFASNEITVAEGV